MNSCIKKILSVAVVTVFSISVSLAADGLTPELAKSKVNEACKVLAAKGKASLDTFRDTSGKFFWANGEGYVWIQTVDDVVMVMHPVKKAMDNKAIGDIKDPKGNRLFVDFSNMVKDNGEGWVEYWWPKKGEKKASPKISFVKGVVIDGKKWLVGSGLYDKYGSDIKKIYPKDKVLVRKK